MPTETLSKKQHGTISTMSDFGIRMEILNAWERSGRVEMGNSNEEEINEDALLGHDIEEYDESDELNCDDCSVSARRSASSVRKKLEEVSHADPLTETEAVASLARKIAENAQASNQTDMDLSKNTHQTMHV